MFKKIFAEAIELAEEAAYTPAELAAYEKYWDAISTEKTLLSGKYKSGREEGIVVGREEGVVIGLEKGREEGERKTKHAFARKLLLKGLPLEEIASLTELSLAEIKILFGN